MKHIFSLLIILLVAMETAQAQNPIPSYNFPVYHQANFQETQGSTRAKKQVNVAAQCGSVKTATCSATVYIYSLDMETVYGPYTLYGGDTLSVEVDGGEWGVYIETEDHVIVDVWIVDI